MLYNVQDSGISNETIKNVGRWFQEKDVRGGGTNEGDTPSKGPD